MAPTVSCLFRAAGNLAITLRKLRRYGDEFPLRVRVLESTSKTRGPEHVDTYRSMVDLAQTHRSLGNHEMALSLFTEAVAGLERTGVEPRTILYQKWAIVSELIALKRREQASLMFDQVVAGAIGQLDPSDPFRKSALRQARAYRLLGRFSRSGSRSRRKGRPQPVGWLRSPAYGNALTVRHGQPGRATSLLPTLSRHHGPALACQGPSAFQTSEDTSLTVSIPYCSDAFPFVSTAIR